MAPPSSRHPAQRPLLPTLRGPQRYDGDDDRQLQQAGRSPTILNAQASAQTLREAARPGSREQNSHSPKPDRPIIPPIATEFPHPHNEIVSSDAFTAVSSPADLIPSILTSSDEVQKEIGNGDGVADASSSSSPSPQRSRSPIRAQESGPVPLTHHTQSLLQPPGNPPISRAGSSLNVTTRTLTPRSVRDLGSDYTRYYNPFAASHNNSQSDLSSFLPHYYTSTHLHPNSPVLPADLEKRLSNPFKDGRRASNPFNSAESTAPATPRNDSSSQVRKTLMVSAAALPPMQSATPNITEGADPEKVSFYPWVDDRLGAPTSFSLYMDEKEDDDDMHMPAWDDDQRYRPDLKDRFSRENIVNTIGITFLLAGLITIFIVLPIVSYTGTSLIPYSYETPLDQMPGHSDKSQAWSHVNDNAYPLLKNIRRGLIDPDTPKSAMTRKSIEGDDLKLVFSDEFNAKNRTFYPGDDPFWFAPDIWYGATRDLEWYDPDAVNTGIHGLWPGIWTMGNLGRPGYLATTDGLWPYTYNDCDAGITPNQSMTDGTSNLPGQRLPSCTCYGEDHPTPGTGRGAPEIDIIEVSADWSGKGYSVATQSFQVAPFDIFYYPNYDFMENPNYNLSFVNTWCGGPYQQAVSTTSMLNNEWYDGKQYQKYAFEYVPGIDKSAYIAWITADDQETMKFDARAVGPNGNIGQRVISEEPLSMVLNLGISHNWIDINFADLKFPTVMRVDYVRLYQRDGREMVTCDPPGYETTDYIAKHPKAYKNPNMTHWSQTGYDWPKNTLMHGCTAHS